MKRVLGLFAVVFVSLTTAAAGQRPLLASGSLTAPAAHSPKVPALFFEASPLSEGLEWKLLASLSSSRYALAAATAPDGSIFAIGGAVVGGDLSAVVEVYRPESNQWSAAPALPHTRYRLAAATGGDGRIYAIGGSDPGGEGAFLSSVVALTPGTEQWVAVAPMSVGRQLLAATTGADGRIYAVGGHNLSAVS